MTTATINNIAIAAMANLDMVKITTMLKRIAYKRLSILMVGRRKPCLTVCEDLAQACILGAIQNYDGSIPLEKFLFGTIKSRVVDYIRYGMYRANNVSVDSLAQEGEYTSGYEIADRSASAKGLVDFADMLSEVLTEEEVKIAEMASNGWCGYEIANTLGMSAGQVSKVLTKIQAKLAIELEDCK
jgi:DNA-directed RNA polymerase specialized sigma24 family protein